MSAVLAHAEIAARRPDCVAGHPGFELTTPFAKYRFEMSPEFPAIERKPGTRDFSRASYEKAPHSLLRGLRGRHIEHELVSANNFGYSKHETTFETGLLTPKGASSNLRCLARAGTSQN